MKKDITYIETIDVHTFACNKDETILGVTDSDNREIVISFSTFELVKTIDTEYMKKQLTKYIKGL
jgi:hypothetical protein